MFASLGVLLGALAAPGLHAQPAARPTANLGAVLDMARAADAQFAAARAAAAVARERLPQALAGLRPSVSASFYNRYSSDGSGQYTGSRHYETSGSSLSLNQPLFRPANTAAVEQAELQVQLAETQLALAEQDLLLRVARGYFEVLQAEDELAAARAQKDALVQQLAQARRSYEVGTVPITDLNEAQARHDLAVAQEIAARNELSNRQRLLERSIARPLPALARLAAPVDAAPLAAARQDELVAAARRDGLPVVVARLAMQVAALELRRRSAGHAPSLDFVLTLRSDKGLNTGGLATPFTNDTRQSSFGFELTIPLYQGGAVSSREREAAAEVQRLQEELSNAERQAELDAQQAQLALQSGQALTQALRQALASSEAQLRSTQRGQQVGVRTRVDVLNAEQQLFVTRRDLAAARYRTLVAALQLRAAAGTLGDADLRALDRLLGE